MVRRQADRWVVARGGTTAVPEGVRDVVGRSARRQRRPARCCRWRPCSAATSTSSCWPRCEMPRRAACLTPWTRRWGRDLLGDGRGPLPLCPRIGPRQLLEELSATRRRRLHWRWAKRPRSCDSTMSWHSPTTSARRAPTAKGRPERCATAWPRPNRPSRPEPRPSWRRCASTRSWDCWTIPPPMRLQHASRRCAAWERRNATRETPSSARPPRGGPAGLQASADAPTLVRAALANSRGPPSMIGASSTPTASPSPKPRWKRSARARRPTGTPARPPGRRALLRRRRPAARGTLDEAGGHRARPRRQRPARVGVNRTGYAAFAPDRVERFVARGEEATWLSDAAGDPAQQVLSRYYWSGAAFTAGDLPRLPEVTRAMLVVSSDAAPTIQRFAQFVQARGPDGRPVRRCAIHQQRRPQTGGGPRGTRRTQLVGSIAMAVEMLRGGIAAVVDAIGGISSQYPDFPGLVDHPRRRPCHGWQSSRSTRRADPAFPRP